MIWQSHKQEQAQSLARKYVPLQPCEVCGSTIRIHRHHTDYDKPLEVMFLCPSHHKQWHVKNTAKNYTKIPPTEEIGGNNDLELPINYFQIHEQYIEMISPEDLHFLQSR